MSVVLQATDISRFRAAVSRRMGLLFEDDKLDYLAEVLRERLEAGGRGPADAYLDRLSAGAHDEVRALARRLTIGETYFFRYYDHFRAFAEVVLPDRARVQEDRRRLRILSAGCASGEEAYSLAILVREHLFSASSWDVQIRGIDINPSMIEKAALARYSAWSLRGTPPMFGSATSRHRVESSNSRIACARPSLSKNETSSKRTPRSGSRTRSTSSFAGT